MGEFKNAKKTTTLRMLIEQIVKETTTIDRKLEGQVATSQALSHEFGLSDAKVAALMQTSKRTAFNHRKALANVRAWEDRTPENKKAAIDRAKRLIAQKSVAEATVGRTVKYHNLNMEQQDDALDQIVDIENSGVFVDEQIDRDDIEDAIEDGMNPDSLYLFTIVSDNTVEVSQK